jgi:hypothetical protein
MRIVRRKSVCHITPQPQAFCTPQTQLRRSQMRNSWEGIGLSVMQCDEEIIDAWYHIAKLGGRPVTLTHVDGSPGRFVIWAREMEDTAMAWGAAQGLLTPRSAWELSWYDEELDDRRGAIFDTRAEAEQEGADYAEAKIEPTTAYGASPALTKRWWGHFKGSGELDTAQATIEATNMYVAAVKPDLDGIWWDEILDPIALSAPRGVILPHALPRWVAKC